jgi:thiol:disulfide interchange protein DsbD
VPLKGFEATAARNGTRVTLDLVANGPRKISQLEFFPFEDGKIEPSAKQVTMPLERGVRLQLETAKQPVGEFKEVAGVLVAKEGWGEGLSRAVSIKVPLTGAAPVGASPSVTASVPETLSASRSGADLSLPLAALFALAGGLLLNLMPCVFPILSIKVLGFAQKSQAERSHLRGHGLAFAAGVVLSFLALAGVIFLARAAGGELGWGFQLQSPSVVTVLAVLFFVLALNLSGVFEFGSFLPASLAGHRMKNSVADSFLSGVLAAVVASPCTAPFMGAALGFALTQSAGVSLVVFAALGIGMALPYVLLSWFPGWLKRLPRPGRWMDRLKQFLAFPLYGTVVWLVWVLALQVGVDGAVRLLASLVVVAFAAWLYGQVGHVWRLVSAAALAGAVALAWPVGTGGVAGPADRVSHGEADHWQAFSSERVAAATASGKAVFVDFTAAWCVTCQVNKRLVLETSTVQNAFARSGTALMRADWTRRDPAITQALADLGRNGVPVYVLYRPGKTPLLLPEILREDIVLDALKTVQPTLLTDAASTHK